MSLLRCLTEAPTLPELRAKFPLLEQMRPYAEGLMRGPSPLSTGERELIAAYVSGLNACRYCHDSHALVAQGFGIDAALLAHLLDDFESAPLSAGLRPLLRYVRKLTVTPSRMTESDAEAVYGAGWDDSALFHAVAICAYFNQMNRLVEGCGIRSTPAGCGNSARRLLQNGYL